MARPAKRSAAGDGGEEQSSWTAVMVIGLSAFVCHFWYLRQFGFYEDDYWATVPHLGEQLPAIGSIIVEAFREWPQGRPLNHSLPEVQAILGMHLGGIAGIYAVACAWFILNGLLVFALLRRLFGTTPALCGALLYVFFPADVTRPFLVHAAHVQGSMTFFLLGSWLWFLGGWRRAAGYLVAALSLLAYETAFLPFLTLPLLAGRSLPATWKSWTKHIAFCAGIVLVDGLLRLSLGESRATTVLNDPWTLIERTLNSLYLGPMTSGARTLQAPIEGLGRLDVTAALSAVLTGIGAYLAVEGARRSRPAEGAARDDTLANGAALYLIACALVTWAGSYALTFVNYPPTQTMGRLTSTHTAAAWGVALLGCTVVACWRGLAASRLVRGVVYSAGLAYLAGSVGFSQWVQREYVRSWQLQQAFWRQVVALTPEATDGWSVIAVGPPAPASPVIATNSWADILVYRALLAQKVDFAHLGYLGQAANLTQQDGVLRWTPEFWTGAVKTIDDDKLIILESDGSGVRRVTEAVTADGTVLHGRPAVGARIALPDTPLAAAMWAEAGK